MKRAYTDDDDRYLIRTHRQLTVAQQARRMGRSAYSVKWRRAQLIARGLLAPTNRHTNRQWSEDEKAAVEVRLKQGANVDTIAAELRRSRRAVADCVLRTGETFNGLRAGRVHTANAVARMFSVGSHTPLCWIARGWLCAQRNGAYAAGAGGDWSITDAALLDFLALREGWVAWQPSQLQKPHWRAYATEHRAQAGGMWLAQSETAQRYSVTPSTVSGWYGDGRMASVATVKWHSTRYFWSADLDAWQPTDRRIRQEAG